MNSSPTVPRLVYFNIEGAAEKARLAMVLAGVEFTDERLQMPSPDWPALKATLPNGQLPVLYFGDKVMCQSGAMARWAARKGT